MIGHMAMMVDDPSPPPTPLAREEPDQTPLMDRWVMLCKAQHPPMPQCLINLYLDIYLQHIATTRRNEKRRRSEVFSRRPGYPCHFNLHRAGENNSNVEMNQNHHCITASHTMTFCIRNIQMKMCNPGDGIKKTPAGLSDDVVSG